MKKISPSYFSKSLFILSAGATFLLMTACSGQATKEETITDAEACELLNGLIADHSNKFAKHKKNKRDLINMNTWDAIEPFPSASNCQIWEWSSGLHSYICNWNSKNGMEVAKADYLEGQHIIQSCLGKDWQAKSNTTTTGGENTLYRKSGSKTIVSIRYFKKSRSILEDWHTTLYIGDNNNLKAAVQ